MYAAYFNTIVIIILQTEHIEKVFDALADDLSVDALTLAHWLYTVCML